MSKMQPANDNPGHQRRLAKALRSLVGQPDIADYRNPDGRLGTNRAHRHAQTIVDTFGLTHREIRSFLDACGDDVGLTADDLDEFMATSTSKLS